MRQSCPDRPRALCRPADLPNTDLTDAFVPSPLTVTSDDNGRTVELHSGQQFVLTLGNIYQWTVRIEDETVVAPAPDVPIILTAVGAFEAHRPGRTVLTASGELFCGLADPPCLGIDPTTPRDRFFRVTIEVR